MYDYTVEYRLYPDSQKSDYLRQYDSLIFLLLKNWDMLKVHYISLNHD